MEWLTSIRKTLTYIEDNLLEDIDINLIAKEIFISPMFLQKGFSIMTGYTIGEYIRNRRLYEAAKEICTNETKIIDIAYKYKYETPESFTKAFTRFHGATPRDIKTKVAPINSFPPLIININISGGQNMKYTIKNLDGFKVVGFAKDFKMEEAQKLIPKFWDEIFEKYAKNIVSGKAYGNEYEKALVENSIGEFGICIDNEKENTITYLIAGKYQNGEVSENMMIYEFPVGEWAIFDCVGSMPKSIQSLSNDIFQRWLPGNPDYELNGNASVEWYDPKNINTEDSNYHSAVWIPVKKRIK